MVRKHGKEPYVSQIGERRKGNMSPEEAEELYIVELAGIERNPDVRRLFLFAKKGSTAIINMTYCCHVEFAKI